MEAPLEIEPTKEDILILREWMAKMPHILQDYDDHTLSVFIRRAKGRLQDAKIRLEKFDGLSYRLPKSFGSHLDPLNKNLQDFLKVNYAFLLPHQTEDGTLMCMLTPRNYPGFDFSNHNWYEIHRWWLMGMFVILWEKLGNTNIILMYDCTDEKFAKCISLTPSFIKDTLEILESFPLRVVSINFLNAPTYFEPLLNFAKTMTKSKLIKRLHFHSDLDSFCTKVPRKCLPKEYGGCDLSKQEMSDLYMKKMESHRNELIEIRDKLRNLDPLRPKSEENGGEMEGTFRQLRID